MQENLHQHESYGNYILIDERKLQNLDEPYFRWASSQLAHAMSETRCQIAREFERQRDLAEEIMEKNKDVLKKLDIE